MTDPNVREQMKAFGAKMYSLRQTSDLVLSHRFPSTPPAYKTDFKSAVIYKITEGRPLVQQLIISSPDPTIPPAYIDPCRRPEGSSALGTEKGSKGTVSKSSFFIESKTFLRPSSDFVVYFETKTGKYILNRT